MADEIEVKLQFSAGREKHSFILDPHSCTVGDLKDFFVSTLAHREDLFSDAGRRFPRGYADEDELARPSKRRRLIHITPIPREELGFVFNGQHLRDEDTLASLGPRFFAYANIIAWRKSKAHTKFPSDLRTELFEVLKYIMASCENSIKAQDQWPPGPTLIWMTAPNIMLHRILRQAEDFIPQEILGQRFFIRDPQTGRIMYTFDIYHLGQGIFRASGRVRAFIDFLLYVPDGTYIILDWADLVMGQDSFPEHRLHQILSFDAYTRPQHFLDTDDMLRYISGRTNVDIEIVRAVMLQHDRLNNFPDIDKQIAGVGKYSRGGREITVSLDYLRRKNLIPDWPAEGAAPWRDYVHPSRPRKRKRDELVEDV